MRSTVVFVTAIILSVVTLQASAQSSTDRESARQLFFDGHKALKAEDYATASELFERAEAMYHAPTTLLGLARARVGMGRLLPAYQTYQRILSERLPASPPLAYAKAIADAHAESAALEPRLSALMVSVSGAPNATVAINGKVTEADHQHYVEPGEHQVTAIARGFLDAKISVTVAPQERKSVELKLRPAEPRRAHESRRSEAAVPDHQGEDHSAERAVGITLTALGIAGLVAGAVTGALYLGQKEIAEEHCTSDGRCDDEGLDAVASANRLGLATTVALPVGGAAVGVGLYFLITGYAGAPQSASLRFAGSF